MIDISLYRIRIGNFNHKLSGKHVFKIFDASRTVVRRKYSRRKMLGIGKLVFKVLLVLNLLNFNKTPTEDSSFSRPYANLQLKPILQNSFVEQYSTSLILAKYLPEEDHNFLARYTNGNKRQHGIRIVHWNKGSSFLKNKTKLRFELGSTQAEAVRLKFYLS